MTVKATDAVKRLSASAPRMTKQRRLITEAFWQTRGHLTAKELHRQLAEQGADVALATVYRTLRLLTQSGVAGEQRFDRSGSRFEPALSREHHDHLICLGCGSVREFTDERIEKLQNRVSRRNQFSAVSHSLQLYGFCQDCVRRMKRGE